MLGTGAGRVHQPGETSIRSRRGKGTGLRAPLLRVHGEDTPGLIVYRNALTRVLCLDRRVAAKSLGTGMNDRCQGRSENLEEQDDRSEPVPPVRRKVVLPRAVHCHYLMPSHGRWCNCTVNWRYCSRPRCWSPRLVTPPPRTCPYALGWLQFSGEPRTRRRKAALVLSAAASACLMPVSSRDRSALPRNLSNLFHSVCPCLNRITRVNAAPSCRAPPLGKIAKVYPVVVP